MIYIPGTSFLHRFHPLTRLCGALLVLTAIFLIPLPLAPLAIFGAVLLLAVGAGVAAPLLRAVLRVVLPIALSLFLIQGLLFPPLNATALPLGPITLRLEGLLFAFVTSTRLLASTAAILLVLQTTHPADLVFALGELGLPRSIGYVLLVSLQIVPDTIARATAILEAQRSRGLETERGLLRVRAIFPLLGPLVVGALVDVEERAMALESRGYMTAGPKTSLRQLVDSISQRIARWLMLAAAAAAVIARFIAF